MVLVTTVYSICFYLTYLVIFPIQNAVFGDIPLYASLLYLPHGARVLAARFYGWKAVLFLAPATLQSHYYLSGWVGGSNINLIPVLGSILCAPISFWIFGKVNDAMFDGKKSFDDWRSMLAIGVLASLLNAISVDLYHSDLPPMEMLRATLAYLIGDITGLFFTMYLLMLSFRWVRKFDEA